MAREYQHQRTRSKRYGNDETCDKPPIRTLNVCVHNFAFQFYPVGRLTFRHRQDALSRTGNRIVVTD